MNPTTVEAPSAPDTAPRTQRGSRRAAELEQLARQHTGLLLRVALHKTGNRQEAEDLVQDTLERGFRKLELYEPGTNLLRWLLKFMSDLALERYRRRGGQRGTVPLETTHPSPTGYDPPLAERLVGAEDVEASAIGCLELEKITRAILNLPTHYGLAVLLADVEQRPYRDIAQVMDVAPGTPMSRIFRGRQLLQTALSEAVGRNA
jgi:RNA polymerase sigma-70 factor (ECF subfamily)